VIEIVEYEDGTYQAFKTHLNKKYVLWPSILPMATPKWEPEYQKNHNFMYFRSLRAVKKAVEKVKKYEEGKQEKKRFTYED